MCEREIKAVLKKYYSELTSELSLEAVDFLWQKDKITVAERDQISSWQSDTSKRTKLIDILMTKDESALQSLIEFLKENGTQNHLLGILLGSNGKSLSSSPRKHVGFPLNIWSCEKPKKFTGRSKELNTLHANLTSLNTTVITHTQGKIGSISGLGGIGKSSLARAYAWKYYGKYYSSVIWIDAESEQSITSSMRKIKTRKEAYSTITDLYEYFVETSERWLLIFDNVECSDFLKSLPADFPPGTNMPCVLITSRLANWPAEVKLLKLELLDPTEAETFILAYDEGSTMMKKTSLKSRRRLAAKLQYLPLAIKQAVVYITKEVVSDSKVDPVEDYLALCDKNSSHLELLNYPFSADEKTVYMTWKVTLDKIRRLESGSIAIEIMEMCAYFKPDGIKTTLFKILDSKSVDRAILHLKSYTMIDGEAGTINIHRLVQRAVQLDLISNKKEVDVVRRCFKTCGVQKEGRGQYKHICSYALARDELVRELSNEILTTFDLPATKRLLQLCVKRFTIVLGTDHENTI